jgi:hypothetical protein
VDEIYPKRHFFCTRPMYPYQRAGVGAFKAQGVTIAERCVIIGIAVRWRGRVAETLLKEDER